MATTASLATDHVFNDDLLANPGDVDWIRRTAPSVLPVLDFPELRSAFAAHEYQANQAQRQTRLWGFVAILCAVAALLATATEPLWGGRAWLPRVVGTGTELIGLLGALVGAGGMWLGPGKRRWLVNRLMTERIRQWHFQFLVYRGDLIRAAVSSADPEAIPRFCTARLLMFDDFLTAQRGKLDSLLTSLIAVNYESEARIIELAVGANHGYEDDRDVFDLISDLYRRLRLRHQLQYAQYKLQTSTHKPWREFLGWPPIVQERILGGLGAACLVLALVVSAAIVLGHVAGLVAGESLLATALEHPALNSLAVCLAIIAVAIRTIEDGLGLKSDIDRYRDYASRMQRLLHDFDGTSGIRNRLRMMEECEQFCFEEMREFLVVHHQTKFVL